MSLERSRSTSLNPPPKEAQIIQSVEYIFRFLVGILAIILLSAHFHSHFMVRIVIPKCFEYVCVIWSTCFLLRLFLRHETSPLSLPDVVVTDVSQIPTATADRDIPVALDEPAVVRSVKNQAVTELPVKPVMDDPIAAQTASTPSQRRPTLSKAPRSVRNRSRRPPHNKNINDDDDDVLYVMDPSRHTRIVPNRLTEPFPLDTEYFRGQMVLLLRTPHVDRWASGAPPGVLDTDDDQRVYRYLQNKQRRFEFQFQVQLKKVPQGRVYFACELRESIQLGLIQRAFVSAAMAFVKSTNPNFHYQMSSSSASPDGRYEVPHMAFPVEEGMSRVVVTPPGETPPVLGSELVESDRSIKQRKKGGGPLLWKADQTTYTFALWSAYVDFWEWKCLNLPGIRPFLLSNVIGLQPITLTLYELLPSSSSTDGPAMTTTTTEPPQLHYRCHTVPIVQLEMSHVHHGGLGPVARQWVEQRCAPNAPMDRPALPMDRPNAVHGEEEEYAASAAVERDPSSDEESIFESEDEAMVEASADNLQENRPLVVYADEGGDATSVGEAFAEELGEGIFVCSGDVISIREAFYMDEDDDDVAVHSSTGDPCYVVNGGGFAVLQEQNSFTGGSSIVIEKVRKSRFLRNHASRSSSRLIKSGDAVIFKLVSKRGRPEDIRYLTIHRGWWLKWVSHFPQKNGFFTIHTNETEFAPRGASSETQSLYLTLGGTFWLSHCRWLKYHVGIASEPSATYGGRMLGLYVPPKFGIGRNVGDDILFYASDDAVDANRIDPALESDKIKSQWMRPLQLQAMESTFASSSGTQLLKMDEPLGQCLPGAEVSTDHFSLEKCLVDVPCFVEIMNRTDRIRQQAYVVRIVPKKSLLEDDNCNDKSLPLPDELGKAFVRLRNGRDLAPIIRIGLKWSRKLDTPDDGMQKQQLDDFGSPGLLPVSPKPVTHRSISVPLDLLTDPPLTPDEPNASVHSFDEVNEYRIDDGNVASSDDEWDVESVDEIGSVDSSDDIDVRHTHPSSSKRTRGSQNLIRKIARSVKTKTSAAARTTTKNVVSRSMKVGLGTVNAGKATVSAGKAILPMRPKKPPLKEPKSASRSAKRHRSRGLRVDVNSRTIRMLERHRNSSILAGELSAPEQSCRTVSNMLSRMSSHSNVSGNTNMISETLFKIVDTTSELDLSFLRGSAAHVGVTPTKNDIVLGALLCDSLVARSLRESHWREEWCGVFENGLSFYAPLTDTPCLELLFSDVKLVRCLDAGSMNPLAGYPLLVIETAWLCHYCAFPSHQTRLQFHEKMLYVLSRKSKNEFGSAALSDELDLAEARFWQGFQTAIQYSQSFGGGKWANIQSGSKSKCRAILNNRRMVFDLNPLVHVHEVNQFVEQLLSAALSFSIDSLKQNPELLIQFLDSTSMLRTLSLEGMNRESPETFCLLANIYHCLLQHALLFSVNGPLHKRSFNHFMRTSCYEIGADVFSLSELHSCVLRGNMSRPTSSKPPYIKAPKKSSAYRFYALRYTNPNINFLLNTADCSFLREVPVVNTSNLDSFLHCQTVAYIRNNVVFDAAKRQVFLPKIFDVYRNDFVTDLSIPGSGHENVRFCLRYLDDDVATQIRFLMEDASLTVKYFPVEEQYYSSLKQASIALH